MATIKLGTTRSANRLISYAEKRAVERVGVDCDPSYAKNQFATTRELYGKTDGIQAHHVIQSFAPGKVTPGEANKIGLELALKLGKGYECAIYTHADKNHIHNHIVINSVSYEDGKKLHLHGKEAIDKVRSMSDDICKEHGLSIIKEPTAKVRYTLAEKSIIEKGHESWKDELRQAIDHEKQNSKTYDDFKENLEVNYGIQVNDKRKHITYKHPDHDKVVRGNKLGLDYERGTIEYGFIRQIEERRGIKDEKELEQSREPITGDQRTEQANAELHTRADERDNNGENNTRERIDKDTNREQRDTRENEIDIERARELATELHQKTLSSYSRWSESNDGDKSERIEENGSDREPSKHPTRPNGKNDSRESERSKKRYIDSSRDR